MYRLDLYVLFQDYLQFLDFTSGREEYALFVFGFFESRIPKSDYVSRFLSVLQSVFLHYPWTRGIARLKALLQYSILGPLLFLLFSWSINGKHCMNIIKAERIFLQICILLHFTMITMNNYIKMYNLVLSWYWNSNLYTIP